MTGVDPSLDSEHRSEPTKASESSAEEVWRGILLGTDGPFHNVIKIRPPMPFDRQDAGRLVETLDRVLRELS